MPNHIAIILDGNRRWAKRNLTIQEKGHFKGADAVENLLDWCEEFDIKIITLYVFCLLYTSPSPRDRTRSRMPSSA